MKQMTKFASLSVVVLFAFSACSDFPDHGKKGSKGSADFSKFMAVGNSITAGYQSGGLFIDAQKNAFPKLIADQVEIPDFQFPEIYGLLGGRITWEGGFDASGSPAFGLQTGGSSASNASLDRPFNNIGIPGIALIVGANNTGYPRTFLSDILDLNSQGNIEVKGASGSVVTSFLHPGDAGIMAPKILRDAKYGGVHGDNIMGQMLNYKPTFLSLWIGNNDVLGYATGKVGTTPVDAATFQGVYGYIAKMISDSLKTTKVITATIPSITSIAYFTVSNPTLYSKGIRRIYFLNNGNTDSLTMTNSKDYTGGMVTLEGSKLISPTTGKGLIKLNPLEDKYVLDPIERDSVNTAVTGFNNAIKGVATTFGWAVADVNKEFTDIATGVTPKVNGVAVTAGYLTGGLFSYDGVHPSDLGQGIIANIFIRSINAKFGATIPEVLLNRLKGVRYH